MSDNQRATTAQWCGTPELFAHIVRVIHAVTSEGQAAPATVSIDIQVIDDHECFESADEFLAEVSPEALREFTAIHVLSSGAGEVRLSFSWRRRWWRPGMGSDSVIELRLSGPQDWTDKADRRVNSALRRGRPNIMHRDGVGTTLGFFGLPSLILYGFFQAAYVFSIELHEWRFVVVIAALALAAFGALFGTWVFPALDIAPQGQGHPQRTWRFVAPMLVAITLAGLTKMLFG